MSLQVWLPLTKDLRQQGLSNVNFLNSGASFVTTGKTGSLCIDFQNGHLYCSNFSIGSTFSISAWIKTVTYGSYTNHYIVSLADYINNKIQFQLGYLSYDGATARWKFNGGGNCGQVQLNTWYHICVTYDGSKACFYENGQLINTYSVSLQTTNAHILTICGCTSNNDGSRISGDSNFLLNDFRIYDHCLSPMEAHQISQGLILHYPLDRQGYGQENLLPHSDDLTLWSKESGISVVWDELEKMYKMSDTTHTSSYYGIYQNLTLSANTTYTFSVEGKKVSSEISLGFKEGTSWPTNGSNFTIDKQRLSITITIGNADASCRIYLYIRPTSGGNNYGYFNLPKLEIGETITPWCPHISDASAISTGLNNEIEYDNSGYCNNGIKTGTFNWTSDTSKYAVSTNFNTTTSIISSITYDQSTVLPEYTVATWAKISENPSIDSYFYKGLLDLYFNSSGKIVYIYSYSLTNGAGSSFSYNLGEWVHIAATRDSTGTLTIYLNGINVYTRTRDMYARHTTDVLGYNKTFTGQLSDFRIYATALSADDVKFLYQNCATIDSDGTIRGQIRS